jgi:hypothetical protein
MTIEKLKQQNRELIKNTTIIQNDNSRLLEQNSALKRDFDQLSQKVKGQIYSDIDDEFVKREIEKIKDPSSYSALRSIVTRTNRLKAENLSLQKELHGESQRIMQAQKMGSSMQNKNRVITGEVKALRAKVDQLKTQNDFLLNELEFSQRKMKSKRQAGAGPKAAQGADGVGGADSGYKKIVSDVCEILRIEDASNLVDSIKTIETAYQFLPSLQLTVENIFKIVTEGNIFDTPINSYDVKGKLRFLGSC